MKQTFSLEEASITEIQEAIKNKKVTSKTLVLMYLNRIAHLDKKDPGLHAIMEINPDAIHIAEALDYEREQKGIRGLLHGIPVLLKDNIDTKDKMHTSAGSLALENSYAAEDAYLVQQLRKAGAVILGKTNMTEWANFMTEGMPPGYSSRGGQVKNPYGKSLSPGGSSSGSGVAVASNFCTVAIGTETSGSVVSPASDNAIVGLKPTIGLVSRSGIIPISHSQDTAGPMGRTVKDVAILLGGMIGVDPKDPITKLSQDNSYKDYTQFLDETGLKGIRLGVPRDFFFDNLNAEEIQIMEDMIQLMEKKGAIIIDSLEIPTARELQSKTVMLYEFKVNLNAYLSKLSQNVPVHSISELIKYNNTYPEKMLKYGQIDLIDSDATSGTLTELDYINNRLKDIELSTEQGIDKIMSENQLDAVIFPSYQGVEIMGKAGYPSITVPAGFLQDGKPFGITFAAEAFSEPKLFKIAYAFERSTNKRVPPNI
jgi:amidase